jgi:hypothetical protein
MGRLSHCRPIAEARPRMPDAPPGAWGRVAGSHGPTPICARGAGAQGGGIGQGACRSGDGARLHGTEPRVWQTRRDARERKAADGGLATGAGRELGSPVGGSERWFDKVLDREPLDQLASAAPSPARTLSPASPPPAGTLTDAELAVQQPGAHVAPTCQHRSRRRPSRRVRRWRAGEARHGSWAVPTAASRQLL